jgi:hypothetical protein
MPLFVFRPFYKIGLGCASAFLLLAANAGARDVDHSESPFGQLGDVNFSLRFEDRSFDGFDSKYPGDHFVDFGSQSDWSDGDSSSKWGFDSRGFDFTDAKDSGKASDHDGSPYFVFDKHGGRDDRHFDYGNPWFAWYDDRGRHDGHGDSGSGCGNTGNGGGDPGNGCGNGDPNGGNSATPEPGATSLALIAASAMALLLVRRQRSLGKRG